MSAKRKAEPYRKRLTIPHADESSATWYDIQDDPSASVRLLIRESIQRDGYVDVINRPVDRQPRRGRPPADGQRETGSDDESGTGSIDEMGEKAAPASGNAVPETEPAAADTDQAGKPAETTTKNTAVEPELHDIFGSMRD